MRRLLSALLAVGLLLRQTAVAQPVLPVAGARIANSAAMGYPTVLAALQGLKAKPGVTMSISRGRGWIVAKEPASHSVWSFTPEGNYAYPAVVRQRVWQEAGQVFIETVALCEAAKPKCDRLVHQFERESEQLKALLLRTQASNQK